MRATPVLALLALACNPHADRAPAEGLWGYEDPATSRRVAALIGPASSAAGDTRVTLDRPARAARVV